MFTMNDDLNLFENFRYYFFYTCDIADAVLRYLKDTFKAFGNALILYLIICVLFYLFNEKYALTNINKFYKHFRRVLIVTAHPDDECMFFGPLIINLLKSECKVFLLCLSSGDHYKLGSERKQELWDSCKKLGIRSSNIFLCKNPFMEDNPNVVWRKEEVAALILDHTDMLGIDAVVTFDEDGVSGHYNHISIFNAVCFLVTKNLLPSDSKVYVLESVNLFRKYSNYLDGLMTYLSSNLVCQIKEIEHKIVVNAMYEHRSQYVWFRKLYMKFSRYAYINSFRLVDSTNMFLEMDDLQAG